jgi:RNA polymerase-binding transcription factor DksA
MGTQLRPGRASVAWETISCPQTGTKMPREERRGPAATAPIPPAGSGGPHWRALLEARWQARLQEVTELSLAYHGAAAAVPDGSGDGAGQQEIQTLLRRAVAARRKLADVEEALGRLADGGFGHCEQCGSAIPDALLAVIPETRYCPRCDTEPARAHAVAERSLR